MSKLTEAEVREIRRRYAAGDGTYLSLACEYDVANGTISAILKGRTWRHLLPATV